MERFYSELDQNNKNKTNIIILDACRTIRELKISKITTGLSRPNFRLDGTFIAYATAPGTRSRYKINSSL